MKNKVGMQVMRILKNSITQIILVTMCVLLLSSGCSWTILSNENASTEAARGLPSTRDIKTDQARDVTEPQSTSTPRYTKPAIIPIVTSTLPTLTAALVPEPTATQIPSHTPTRLPTISVPEAEEFIMELYRTNEGCKLPCWWGIIPGQTSDIVAKRFLESFAFEGGFCSIGKWAHYEAALPAPPEVYGTFFQQDYTMINGTVDCIMVWELFPSPFYNTISSFLSSVGPPEEIWILSSIGLYRNLHPFEIMLFYPQQGILVYFGDNAVLVGNKLEGCPYQADSGPMFLWASGADKSFKDWIYEAKWGYYNYYYLPLESATGMDVTTFYETFKRPYNQACLRTPIDVWPTPGAMVEEWPTITPQTP